MRRLMCVGVIAAGVGCRSAGAPAAAMWDFNKMPEQSQTGPQPFVVLDAIGPPSSDDLVIECAPDGLQMTYRGWLPEAGAVVQFDETPPLTLPLLQSRRGVPVVALQAPLAGSAGTAEDLLVASSRLSVNMGEEPVVFDITDVQGAIKRLRCPAPR